MSKESHSFSVTIAAEVGVLGAIFFQHFLFLNKENAKNTGKSLRDSPVRRTIEALQSTYPYLTPRQIRHEIEKLEKIGVIQGDKRDGYDRTKSYFVTSDGLFLDKNGHLPNTSNAFDKNGKSICQICKMDLTNLTNGFDKFGKSYKVGYLSYCTSYSTLLVRPQKFEKPAIQKPVKQAPPVPPPPPAEEQVNDLQNAIETAMRYTQEQPAQIQYWFECARISGWTPERLKQEVALFFSYYFRTLESPHHICRKNPQKFFADGFLGWLMRCDKNAAIKSNTGQPDKKRAVNNAQSLTAAKAGKQPF